MQTRFITIALVLAAAFTGASHAADDHGRMNMQAPASAPLTEALVKKVDKATAQVTLAHGPMPNGMPAMTMAFRLKERAWADQLKEGSKIRFAADQVDGVMTVVRYELVK